MKASPQDLENALAKGDLKTAQAMARSLVAAFPANDTVLSLAGVLEYRLSRLPQAAGFFDRAARANPLAADHPANLGKVLRKLGQLDKARQNLEKSLSLARTAETCFDLASLCIEQGQLAEAMDHLDQALVLDPDHQKSLNDMALVARKLATQSHTPSLFRKAQQALDHLKGLASSEGPAHQHALKSLYRDEARYLASTGQLAEALDLVREHLGYRKPVLRDLGDTGQDIAPVRVFKDGLVYPGDKDWFVCDRDGKVHLAGLMNANIETSPWCAFVTGDGQKICLENDPDRVRNVDEPAILLGSGGNYWHWMIDYLPRLYALEGKPEFAGLALLVADKVTPFQRDTLRMAGFGKRALVQVAQDRIVRAAHLVAPTTSNHRNVFDLEALARLKADVLKTAKPSRKPPERLYITRRKATKRKIINEHRLIKVLKGFGFAVLDFDTLKVADQAIAFNSAQVVMAPHGAAFTNMIFARSGLKVIELVPGGEEYPGYFRNLAKARGLPYAALPCTVSRRDGDVQDYAHDLDLVVNVEAVTAFLEKNIL